MFLSPAVAAASEIPKSDGQLLSRSLDEPELFAAFYARYRRRVLAYVLRQVGPSEGEDIVAETFVEAFTCRQRVPVEREDAYPWLVGIARNRLRHHHRHNAVRARHAHSEAVIDLTDTPFDEGWHASAVAADAKPSLIGALTQVSDADRDTLLLHVWGDLTYTEVAAVLEVPVGTVRSRISRAKRVLRGQLGPDRVALDVGAVFHGLLEELPDVPPTPDETDPATSRVWVTVAGRVGLSQTRGAAAALDRAPGRAGADPEPTPLRIPPTVIDPLGPDRRRPAPRRRVVLIAAAVVALLLGSWFVVRTAVTRPVDVIDLPGVPIP